MRAVNSAADTTKALAACAVMSGCCVVLGVGMVKRGPWNVVQGMDHAAAANTLADLAEDVRDDPDVTGVMVVVHRRESSSREFQVVRSGIFKRSISMVVLALVKAKSFFV